MFFLNMPCDLLVTIKEHLVFRRITEKRSTMVLTSCDITVTAQYRLQYKCIRYTSLNQYVFLRGK